MGKYGMAGFVFGPIAAALFGFIVVPITAWVFPAEDIGRLNVLQIALSFSLLFFVLGMDQAFVREYHDSKDKPQLLITCFVPGLVFLLMAEFLAAFFSEIISYSLFTQESKFYFYGMMVAFLMEYVNRFLSLILRMKGQGWAYSFSIITPKVVQVILICGLYYASADKTFNQLLLVILLSQFAMLIIFVWYTHMDLISAARSEINSHEMVLLLKYGFPLMWSGVAYWGLIATSTISLRNWSTMEELAIYSITNSFAGAAALFQSIFTVVWSPIVYKWASKGEVNANTVLKIANQALAIICLVTAIGGAFSWVTDFLLPEKYISVKYILICLMLQPLLYTLSEITSVGIGIMKKPIFSLIATGLALIVGIVVCYVLVPDYGASGAAVGNVIAFATFFIIKTEASARVWKGIPRIKIYTVISILVFASIVMAVNQDAGIRYVQSMWLCILVVFMFVFKDEWKELMQLLKMQKNDSSLM